MTVAEVRTVNDARDRKRYEDIYDLASMMKVAILSSLDSNFRFPEKIHDVEEPVDDWRSSKAYLDSLYKKGGRK